MDIFIMTQQWFQFCCYLLSLFISVISLFKKKYFHYVNFISFNWNRVVLVFCMQWMLPWIMYMHHLIQQIIQYVLPQLATFFLCCWIFFFIHVCWRRKVLMKFESQKSTDESVILTIFPFFFFIYVCFPNIQSLLLRFVYCPGTNCINCFSCCNPHYNIGWSIHFSIN